MNVFFIHQYSGNKGDRAVLVATLALLRSRYPEAVISISTSEPGVLASDSSLQLPNVSFVPSAWDYRQCTGSLWTALLQRFHKYTFTLMRESFLLGIGSIMAPLICNSAFLSKLRSADIVVSVGGHHFTTLLSRDLVSNVNFDATVVLALKKRLVCFSQSFGPFVFHNPRNKSLTRKILNQCDVLYCRDAHSVVAMTEFGVHANRMKITFETVLTLNKKVGERIPMENREKRIGISVYTTTLFKTPDKRRRYISVITAFCNAMTERGYQVVFFPMEFKGTRPDDRPVIRELLNGVSKKESCTYFDNDLMVNEHLGEVAKCSLFLGHKTHSVVFALTAGTPVIALAYHTKTFDFMSQFGLEDYCIGDDDVDLDKLVGLVNRIEPRLDDISNHIFKRAAELASRVKSDFNMAIGQ